MSSILPASRSIGIGETATVFASVINAGSDTARGCTISLGSENLPVLLKFSPTDAAANTLLLSVSAQPTADLITLIATPSIATPSADGVMRLGQTFGSQLLAIATSHVGTAETLKLPAE